MYGSDIHILFTGFMIRKDDCCAGIFMIAVAFKRPSDHIRVVEPVVLFAIQTVSAHFQHRIQNVAELQSAARFQSVVVAVENAWISLSAKQDQRIGKRHEPRFHTAFKRLSGLRIMVIHKCDCVRRIHSGQRSAENLRNIIKSECVGNILKCIMQRNIKQGHAFAGFIQIVLQFIHIGFPVLTHGEQFLSAVLPEFLQPGGKEFPVDMLERIQAEPVLSDRIEIPLSPFDQMFPYFRISEVDIQAEKIIIIPVLIIHFLAPLTAGEPEHRVFSAALIFITPRKIPVVPDKITVFSVSAGKCKPAQRTDRLHSVRQRCIAVMRIILGYPYRFQFVSFNHLVEHDIRIDTDSRLMAGINCRKIFFLCAVFCRNRSFLIELSEVIQIVDCVSDLLISFQSFICRRQPECCDSLFREYRCFLLQLVPQTAVRRKIPFEVLHHDSVFSVFLFCHLFSPLVRKRTAYPGFAQPKHPVLILNRPAPFLPLNHSGRCFTIDSPDE